MMRPFGEHEISGIGETGYLIAHACGSIDGKCYTNSKEALLSSLDKGCGFIEVDLYLTPDSDVICLHTMEEYIKMTGSRNLSEFRQMKLYGKYTPMTLEDAVTLWEEKQFVIVTDKMSATNVLDRYFKHNRDRVMVEVNNIKDFHTVKAHGYIPLLTVSSGMKGLIKYLLCMIVSGDRIDYVVTNINASRPFLRLYKRFATKVFVFASNDLEWIKENVGKEVDMVYTDYTNSQ